MASLAEKPVREEELVASGGRPAGQGAGFFEEARLQVVMPPAHKQKRIAEPAHAGFACGQLLALLQVLLGPGPLLAGGVVQQ